VTGIGTDSQIQKIAISRAAPAVRHPSGLKPGGGGNTSVRINAPGPRIQPDSCRRLGAEDCSAASGSRECEGLKRDRGLG
jgi:hypothetical protein